MNLPSPLATMTPLDRLLAGVGFGLLMAIILVIVWGDHTFPKVKAFNYAGQTVNPRRAQLLVTFNQEMDHRSVEAAWRLTPAVTGRFSWIGKKLAFTPLAPLPRGQTFQLQIQSPFSVQGQVMPEAFQAEFRVSPRRFLFLGSEKTQWRRLMLADLASQTVEVLTPPEFAVFEYQAHPDGKRVFLLANESSAGSSPSALLPPRASLSLYELDLQTRQLEKRLSHEGYNNYAFRLSPAGESLALGRIQVDQQQIPLADRLWVGPTEERLHPLWYKEARGTPFFWTPDERFLLSTDPNGFVLVPLSREQGKPQYVGRFSQAYGFNEQGTQVLFAEMQETMLTRTYNHLVLYSAGARRVLMEGQGEIQQAMFGPGDSLYFLLRRATPRQRVEDPFHLVKYQLASDEWHFLTQGSQNSEEAFDVNERGDLIFERFPLSLPGDAPGPEFRRMLEVVENTWESADLWLYEEGSSGEAPLPWKGRSPQWLP